MPSALMDFNDAMTYLRVSRATLYRLIRSDDIPAFKLGGQWRFKKDMIDEWIEAKARPVYDQNRRG